MRAEIRLSLEEETAVIDLDCYARGLYEQWMETGDKDVFADLGDHIYDAVATKLTFEILDIKPSG